MKEKTHGSQQEVWGAYTHIDALSSTRKMIRYHNNT